MNTIIEKVQLSSGKTITFTLKENAINIFEEPQNNLWTFDLSGRLVGMFINYNNYRRTLNNRYYLKSRFTIRDEQFRDIKQIPFNEIEPLIEQSRTLIRNNQEKLSNNFSTPLENILKMNSANLQLSTKEFNDIYLPISILPPDQYMSLVIQMTEGCNYNQCTFCNFYRDRPFKIKSEEELGLHLSKVKSFIGEGISLRKSIFLADANALTVPQNRLVKCLELIHRQFPQFKNYYSFIDVFTGLKKSVDDFKQLNKLGIKRVYLGVESGNSDLMLFLNKIQINADIIELTQILKEGGIDVGIVFLVGAGGKRFADRHQKDSVDLLQKLPLSKGDIVYLSELYDTNPDYIDSMKQMNYDIPSQLEIRKWSNNLKDTIKKSISKEIQVSIYDINQFFY